jgi:hypothetical protein
VYTDWPKTLSHIKRVFRFKIEIQQAERCRIPESFAFNTEDVIPFYFVHKLRNKHFLTYFIAQRSKQLAEFWDNRYYSHVRCVLHAITTLSPFVLISI